MRIEVLKAFFLGVIQGITEWLPISSTGHLILFEEVIRMNGSEPFREMFRVVIQFGSILAVLILYGNRLLPWGKTKPSAERRQIGTLWLRILIAAIPAGVVGVLFDDWLDEHLYNARTVAAALIVYGIAFIGIERVQRNRRFTVNAMAELSNRTAFEIGCFQMLSLIPGTSRSGSTILGALCVGVNRTTAAEFSFFLAIPVLCGASLLKILKYIGEFGIAFTSVEWVTLLTGTLTAFAVSMIVIRFLMSFVRRHSFECFGWYRIGLGLLVLLYSIVK